MSKTIENISELAGPLGFTAKDQNDLQNTIDNYSMSRLISMVRVKNKMTQKAFGTKICKSQAYVSKVENLSNDDLNIKDLTCCLQPFGIQVGFSLSKPKTIKQRLIDNHNELFTLIEDLKNLEREDEHILQGLAELKTEAAGNYIKILETMVQSTRKNMDQIDSMKELKIDIDKDLVGFSEISSKEKSPC
ncbi:MAG: hypothetical protein OCD01_10870 [Fibrobacterales bacterium]